MIARNRLLWVFSSAAIVVSAAWSFGQMEKESSPAQKAAWQKLRALSGVWKGTDDTQSPPSSIERRFEIIADDQFLLVRTTSVAGNETHEDWTIFSYDGIQKRVMMRQFAGEGFVNTFALDDVSPDGNTMTFLSQSCENAPPGFRVRMQYTFAGDNAFEQRMDLAPPGAEFSQCVGGKLRRQ